MSQGTALVKDRSLPQRKAVYGLGMIALAVGLGFLVPRYGFMAGMGAFIVGAAGLGVVVSAFAFSGRGPCPTCGAELRGVPKDAAGVLCSSCRRYAISRDGHLFSTPDDHIAAEPIYEIRVEPGHDPLPHLCVACGAPAEASVERELQDTIIGVQTVARVFERWTVSIPLCARHDTRDSLGNPPGLRTFENLVTVGSYRTWRAAQPDARQAAPDSLPRAPRPQISA